MVEEFKDEKLNYSPPATQKEEKEEKLEYLKRTDIKTMQKDIAELREVEAQTEREKIAALKIKEEKVSISPLPAKEEGFPLGALIPKVLFRKPPHFKKILVRVAVLGSIFLIGFLVWFFGAQPPVKVIIPPGETPPIEGVILPEEETPVQPEIVVPPSLISVAETKTREIVKTENIPEVFNQLTAEELSEGNFFRVVIKNIEENRLASLEDLATTFQVEVPSEIYQKLKSDYTLAVYSQKQGKRIALIGEVKEETGLKEILKNWEEKIKEDGVSISGKKIQALVPYFKTAFYNDVGFRYLTISKSDFGICYAWFDINSEGIKVLPKAGSYFVLTTSFESLKKIIDELKSKVSSTLEEKAGQLLIVGFEGKTITPQLEEFFKKYKPGGVLLLSKNIESKEQLKNLISGLQNLSLKETGLPLFVAVDQEGEPMSRIGFAEEKTPQSEIENAEQAYQIGLERGRELKTLGVNLNLAPLLDIVSSGDFIFERSFQKNPEEIGNLAKALISGQKTAGVLTAIKHFPGYTGVTFNPEEELAILEKIPEISQFKKAVEANPELAMTSNVVYEEISPSLPFTFSPEGIQYLKNNLSSQLLIVSDDLDQNSLLEKFSLKEIMTTPLKAGVDILIFSGWRLPVEQGLDAFLAAIKNGEISEAKINESVSKIIQIKQIL